MGIFQKSLRGCYNVEFVIIILVFLAMRFDKIEAIRILKDENESRQTWLLFESLPKGSASSTGASPCTFIPKTGKGRCAMEIEGARVGTEHRLGAAPPTNSKDGIQVVYFKS